MKNGKRLAAAVLSAVLCLTLFGPMSVWAATPVFVAVNDRVLEMTAETAPIQVGEERYVPYTVFDGNANGVRWSLQCSYSKSDNHISVYDLDKRLFLEFDLREGTCWDGLTGEEYELGAVLRGSRPYLPLDLMCQHFGLTYSDRTIPQGKLLRIKDEEAVLSDTSFIDAATNVFNLRLREYNQQNAVESAGPGQTVPGTSVGENKEPEVSVPVYLSFRCEDAGVLEMLLVMLENRKAHGVIFVSPELARERGDLMFWITGAGHTLGLLAGGGSPDEVRTSLAEGRRALEEEVFLRPTVAYTGAEFRAGLEQEGWVCWNSTLDLAPTAGDGAGAFARRTLNRLEGRTKATYLSLDVSEHTLRVLPSLLAQLEDAGFELALPLETRL